MIVVARKSAKPGGGTLGDVRIVINEVADEGIASSIRCGVAAAERYEALGAVLLTCDQPGLSGIHIHALIANPTRLTASAYAGTVGIPAYFPAEFFSCLLELRGDTGARSMLKGAYCIRAEDLELDVDTEDDLRAARAVIEGGPTSLH
jgi:CTP:molybdopterin cytidylyltransferase MocA